MNKVWNKIKQEFEEHPVQTILVLSILLSATAKIIEASSAAQGRRAYAQNVKLRARGL